MFSPSFCITKVIIDKSELSVQNFFRIFTHNYYSNFKVNPFLRYIHLNKAEIDTCSSKKENDLLKKNHVICRKAGITSSSKAYILNFKLAILNFISTPSINFEFKYQHYLLTYQVLHQINPSL